MPSLDPKIDELIDWSRHREADEEDPRALGAGPRRGKHVPDRKWRRNKFAIWIDCARCALRLETAPMKSAPASHHKKVKVEIVETALKLIEEDRRSFGGTAGCIWGSSGQRQDCSISGGRRSGLQDYESCDWMPDR